MGRMVENQSESRDVSDSDGAAVVMRGCSIGFKNAQRKDQLILDNLDLTVKSGTIYALLGASGCGKTTLLKCILGRLQLRTGLMLVLGYPPGSKENTSSSVGYMPQEISLYEALTIAETLRFYGRLSGKLSNRDLETKIDFLTTYLRLPDKNTVNSKLSGGEIRRVSFIAAILHEPKLIIIDEPTVGMDPIVKQRVWEYLMDISRNKMSTVILTTHYIEEASQVDRVGMLQWGRLQTEDNPQAMIRKQNCRTLEECFISLCLQLKSKMQLESKTETEEVTLISVDGDDNKIPGSSNNGNSKEPLKTSKLLVTSSPGCSCPKNIYKPNFNRISIATWKNFVLIYRFPGVILLSVILPIVQVTMFMLVFNGQFDGTMVGVVNEDAGTYGKVFLNQLSTRSLVQVEHENNDTGFRSLFDGDTSALVTIGKNFTNFIEDRITNGLFSTNRGEQENVINVHLESTNYHIMERIKIDMMTSFMQFVHSINHNNLTDHNINVMPIEFKSREISWMTIPQSSFLAPGFCINVIHFCPFVVSILLIFLDKQHGYMERNIIAGVTITEAILAVFLNECVAVFIQTFCVLIVAYNIIAVPLLGSYLTIFLLMFVQGMAGSALGVFIAMISKDCLTMANLSMLMMFLVMPLSGLFWPLQAMPSFYKAISLASPYYYPGAALKGITFKGWSISHPDVLLGLFIPVAWFVVFVLATIPASKRLGRSR